MYDGKKVWRQKFREAMYKSFGGKCGICGYNRCYEALDLHHLDPSKKDKNMSYYVKNGGKWDKVSKEANKCVCLCSNCHREVHAGIVDIPIDIQRFDDSLLEPHEFIGYRPKFKVEYEPCSFCDGQKRVGFKYCSAKCASDASRKVHLGKEDLHRMIVEEGLSYSSIGRAVGVSDNAIRKKAKKLGIVLPQRQVRKK